MFDYLKYSTDTLIVQFNLDKFVTWSRQNLPQTKYK